MLPSLEHKTRAVIDDFNKWSKPGQKFEAVIKHLMRKHDLTFADIRKIFKKEVGVDIGNKKTFYKKIHKRNEVGITGYHVNIKNEGNL